MLYNLISVSNRMEHHANNVILSITKLQTCLKEYIDYSTKQYQLLSNIPIIPVYEIIENHETINKSTLSNKSIWYLYKNILNEKINVKIEKRGIKYIFITDRKSSKIKNLLNQSRVYNIDSLLKKIKA